MTTIPNFPHLEGLFDLACRDGVDIRQTLLRVLTDLYVQKPRHNPEEEAQYVELVQRLIETVDAPTRATVAARLAAYPQAPAAIFDRLAALIGSQPEAPAPAETKAGASRNELLDLFFAAESDERRLIIAGLNAVNAAGKRQPVLRAAEICRDLEAAALARNNPEFLRILERTFTITPPLAARVVEDPHGEPLLVLARALEMTAPALQRILLFLNPVIGQSVARVYELTDLYGEIGTHAAWQMIDIWKGTAKARPKAKHTGVYHGDEERSARAAATPTHYGSGRRSEPLAARFKNIGR